MSVIAVTVAGVLLVGGLISVKVGNSYRLHRSLVAYRLQFPRGLEAEHVESLIGGLSGMLLPWWRRWAVTPTVIIELRASGTGVRHTVLVPSSWHRTLENLMQAAVPSVRFERCPVPMLTVAHAAEYRLTNAQRELRVSPASLSLKLLSSLQPLDDGEEVVVQWLLTPAGPTIPGRVASQSWLGSVLTLNPGLPDSESLTAQNRKHARPLMHGVGRIGATARNTKRAQVLIRQVEGSWHEVRAPGVHFRRRSYGSRTTAGRTNRRLAPLVVWPGTFNSAELSGLIGWPIDSVAIPGVPLGGSRQVAASPQVPRIGTIIADSTFPGDERPLALDIQARLRHLHILGPTGTGKSTLIVNMVVQDLTADHGIVLLDPKGDLATDITERIRPERAGDVILLDPADDDFPVGLNPLHSGISGNSEVVVENLVGLFKSLYRSSWGPRTDDVLRASLMTLAAYGDATLCEVPLLLTNRDYRRRVVGQLDDPIGLESFWGWYEALGDGERLAVVGPVLNKVRAFTMRPRVRAIIGQSVPTWSMAEVLQEGKILIVSLASGLLGDEAGALLGALVVAELWNATTARAGMPASQRKPVMGYLDEWSRFLHLPTPMASVLAEARGLGLGLTLAHQHLGQLPEEARDAVLSNARSRVLFQLPASDARIAARELGGVLSADDLQGLGGYEVAFQLFANGTTQAPATARTRPMPPPSCDPKQIRAESRRRYGVARSEVEAAIRERQIHRVEAPVQRRRSRGND